MRGSQSHRQLDAGNFSAVVHMADYPATILANKAILPPMVLERPRKEGRPSPSSLDADLGPQPKKPKAYNENPFDMLHLECFTYVMSALGERGLTMYVQSSLLMAVDSL